MTENPSVWLADDQSRLWAFAMLRVLMIVSTNDMMAKLLSSPAEWSVQLPCHLSLHDRMHLAQPSC